MPVERIARCGVVEAWPETIDGVRLSVRLSGNYRSIVVVNLQKKSESTRSARRSQQAPPSYVTSNPAQNIKRLLSPAIAADIRLDGRVLVRRASRPCHSL